MITLTKEQAQQIEEALEGIQAIMSDSKGVAGYHLNGEVADWDYFDDVNGIDEALSAIRAARAQEQEPVAEIIGFERTNDMRGVKRIPRIKWNVPLWEDESPLQLGNLYAALSAQKT